MTTEAWHDREFGIVRSLLASEVLQRKCANFQITIEFDVDNVTMSSSLAVWVDKNMKHMAGFNYNSSMHG